jgi:hypothetical protein
MMKRADPRFKKEVDRIIQKYKKEEDFIVCLQISKLGNDNER